MSVNPVRQKLPQKFIYKTLPNQSDVKQTAEAHLLLSPGDNVDGTWDIAESRIGWRVEYDCFPMNSKW